MTEEQERLLKHFETRVRQTMLLCESLRKENADLKEALTDKQAYCDELEIRLSDTADNYEKLRLGLSLSGKGEDINQARTRISKLVREINACIALIDE